MTSKFTHLATFGLLVMAGYYLSLGVEGRSQVLAMSEVVGDSYTQVSNEVSAVSSEMQSALSNVSFANVYSALGLLIGASPSLGATSAASVSDGLVVAKSIDVSADTQHRVEVQATFSDKVKVHPDASKKSGTITPVFRSGEGEKYMYVIVPVKK